MPTEAPTEAWDRKVRDLAQQTGISTRSAIRVIDAGQLPAKKFGKSVRLRQSDIDAYIERSNRPASAREAPTVDLSPPARRRRGRPRVEA
jgi:excisionase family DNA binding protein